MCTHARRLVSLRLQLGFEMCTHARRLVSLRLQLGFEVRTHARPFVSLRFRGRCCFSSVCFFFFRRTLQCCLQPRYDACEALTLRLTLRSLRLHRGDARLYLRKLLVRTPLL